MKGHNPDMSGAREGRAVKFRDACDYVPQPKNAYGKTHSGLQPSKARTHSYTPDPKGTTNLGGKA